MTNEQGKILDKIILEHNKNNGVFEWNPYIMEYGFANSHDYRIIMFVLEFLKEEKIISEFTDNLTTQLTEKGQNWTNYKEYIKEIKNKKEAEKRETWQKRHWLVIAIITGIIAYLGGLFTDPISKVISDKWFHNSAKPSIMEKKDSVSGFVNHSSTDSLNNNRLSKEIDSKK